MKSKKSWETPRIFSSDSDEQTPLNLFEDPSMVQDIGKGRSTIESMILCEANYL